MRSFDEILHNSRFSCLNLLNKSFNVELSNIKCSESQCLSGIREL